MLLLVSAPPSLRQTFCPVVITSVYIIIIAGFRPPRIGVQVSRSSLSVTSSQPPSPRPSLVVTSPPIGCVESPPRGTSHKLSSSEITRERIPQQDTRSKCTADSSSLAAASWRRLRLGSAHFHTLAIGPRRRLDGSAVSPLRTSFPWSLVQVG